MVYRWSYPSTVSTTEDVVVIDPKLSSSSLSTFSSDSEDVKHTKWEFPHQHRVPLLVYTERTRASHLL